MTKRTRRPVSAAHRLPSGELRIQPRDIRHPGWTIRLDRRRLRWLQAIVAVGVAFVLAAAAVSPRAIRERWNRANAVELAEQQTGLAEALRGDLATSQAFKRRLEDLERRLGGVAAAFRLEAPRVVEGAPEEGQGPRPGETMLEAMVRQVLAITSDLERRLVPLEARLDGAERFEREHPDATRWVPSAGPLRGSLWVLTARFGPWIDPFTHSRGFHAGIDMAAEVGETVRSPADGVVTYAGAVRDREGPDWRRLGLVVVVRHGEQWLSLFGHLQGTQVAAGQKVRRGDPLGTVGTSGWSVNSLLHYELRRFSTGRWRAIDPWPLLLDETLVDEGIAAPVADFRPSPRPAPLPASFLR